MEFDSRGIIATIIIHALILLACILFGFITPLPLPGEAGILINFGDENSAFGPEEPKYNIRPPVKTQPENKPETVKETSKETPILTQDFEEAPSLPVKKEKKAEKKKVDPKKNETPAVKETKAAPVKEEPKVDSRALYGGRKNNTEYTGSQGIGTGEGNMGNPDGSPESLNYGEGGGSGNAPGFYLSGRNSVSLPVPSINLQKRGKVVVTIKVDRDGNVVEAIPGAKGSTTLDSYLLGVAKNAALSSRFDSKPNAPFYQTGTITYIFHY